MANATKGKRTRVNVVLRWWKDTGSIIALFPDVQADPAGRLRESYMACTGHGGADYAGVIDTTDPIDPTSDEARAMLAELRRIGYRVKVASVKGQARRALYTTQGLYPQARRLCRRLAKAEGNCPVVVIPGRQPPTLRGRRGYWTTPNGDLCRYPNAYRRAFGRPRYHQSTLRVEVGADWLAGRI